MNEKGLLKLKLDTRDYSHSNTFGNLGASQLPTQDFTVYDSFPYTIVWGDTLSNIANKFKCSLKSIADINKIIDINKIKFGQVITIPARDIKILNQLSLDFCSAYTTAELQKLIFGQDVDPLYQMSKIKQIMGSYEGYGADLRDACNSVIKYGSLPLSKAPFTFGTGLATDKTRDFLANWVNYPIALDSIALIDKDASYFAVDGQYDVFDNIRQTLYMHRTERRAVTFGLFWHDEWTLATGGIIPPIMPTTMNGGGHDMAIIGQKTINGVMYLVFQQTWGDTAGDNGFYYLPRSIVDQMALLGYGAYTFSRTDKTGITGAKNWLVGLLTSLFKKLQ